MGILNPNWKPDDSMRPPRSRDPHLPNGWRRLGVAYSDGHRVIVTGQPEPEDDEDNPKHNCDQMGCGFEHVIAIFEMPEERVKALEDARSRELP